MLMLAVLLIFAAMVMAIAWSTNRNEPRAIPIPIHRDEHSLHHQRNLPGPGAE